MCVVCLLLCDGQKPVSQGFRTVRDITLCSRTATIPSRMANGECAQISAHPCESVASTSDNHNFLVQTPICAILDSTENLLSLEFYKMKCSSKPWAEHWAKSWTVEEWSVLVFGTSVFGTSLYLKCLWLFMA